MFTCMYQVQEFNNLGMAQLLVKGTCKLLMNLPSSIVIQMWTVMKHWSMNPRLLISECMSLGVWFCGTWSSQSHTSNNYNFWYCILIILRENYMIFKTVEWLKHILIIFVFLFSPPWRWPHECPKHVGDHYAVKLHP